MKTKNKIITFNQAKKLDELGFKQKSENFYSKNEKINQIYYNDTDLSVHEEYYPAYDTTELFDILLNFHSILGLGGINCEISAGIRVPESKGKYIIKASIWSNVWCGDTQAEALGDLLIWLLETNMKKQVKKELARTVEKLTNVKIKKNNS